MLKFIKNIFATYSFCFSIEKISMFVVCFLVRGKMMYFQMLLLILDQRDTKVWIPYFSQCAKNISLLFLSHANLDLNIQYSSKQFTYT